MKALVSRAKGARGELGAITPEAPHKSAAQGV